MALFRLFRRKGGRHAAPRATAIPPAPQQPAFLPLYATLQPPAAAQREPEPHVPAPTSGVGLVFGDGSAVTLDPADPRVRVFREVAGHLLSR